MTNYSRRQFLGVVGAGAVASTGVSQPVSAQETPIVKMENNYFDPIGLYVEPGTTVRFDLAAGSHSATAYPDRIPDGATVFDSRTISQGSFEHTFETPGTYDYYCIPHKSLGMVGRIVVGSPRGPAEESSIPDGELPTTEDIVEQGAVAYGSSGDSGESSRGGMMGPGRHGMMSGRNSGWIGATPVIGGALGTLGIIGGGLYWILSRGNDASGSDEPAKAVLRDRYAREEIDEEEFRRRSDRLADSEE